MQLHLVAKRPDLANLLQYHLGPTGLELEQETDPLRLLGESGPQMPAVVLWSADDFPRQWKPVLAHLRNFMDRTQGVFVLLANGGMEPDDLAKATHLGVNGILTEDVTTRNGANRLMDLLRRYGKLQERRVFPRHLVGDFDQIGLSFIHPGARTLITCQVTEISAKGASLAPDRPERVADLRMGTDLQDCSLRAGESIVRVTCRVMRAGRDLGLQFLAFEEGAQELLQGYIQERPDRVLRAALESGRLESLEVAET